MLSQLLTSLEPNSLSKHTLTFCARYISLLSAFKTMLKEEPVRTRQPIAGVVTPSKVNQAGRSAVRIKQQQQRLQCSEQGALLDTSTPSKVAVGHDFR
jgi:hypothetical protein